MKKVMILCWVLMSVLFLGGCRLIKIEEGNRAPLEYTIAEDNEIPEEARALIREKKETEFQLTYQKGEDLYLIKGYGRQMSGGYSIQVKELSASSSAVFFATKLLGPSEEEMGGEPSYPYIVVKIAYRDAPVTFG